MEEEHRAAGASPVARPSGVGGGLILAQFKLASKEPDRRAAPLQRQDAHRGKKKNNYKPNNFNLNKADNFAIKVGNNVIARKNEIT